MRKLLIILLLFASVMAVNCGDWISQNTVLTGDLVCNGLGLRIGSGNWADNSSHDITLDCNDHTIKLNPGWGIGIEVYSSDRAIIKNCVVSDFNTGIKLITSNNVIVENTVACDNRWNDLECTASTASGVGNVFTNVQACANGWPVAGQH